MWLLTAAFLLKAAQLSCQKWTFDLANHNEKASNCSSYNDNEKGIKRTVRMDLHKMMNTAGIATNANRSDHAANRPSNQKSIQQSPWQGSQQLSNGNCSKKTF